MNVGDIVPILIWRSIIERRTLKLNLWAEHFISAHVTTIVATGTYNIEWEGDELLFSYVLKQGEGEQASKQYDEVICGLLGIVLFHNDVLVELSCADGWRRFDPIVLAPSLQLKVEIQKQE